MDNLSVVPIKSYVSHAGNAIGVIRISFYEDGSVKMITEKNKFWNDPTFRYRLYSLFSFSLYLALILYLNFLGNYSYTFLGALFFSALFFFVQKSKQEKLLQHNDTSRDLYMEIYQNMMIFVEDKDIIEKLFAMVNNPRYGFVEVNEKQVK